MENHARYLELCWAAQRSGLYFVPISWHLHPDEIAYILENSGAKLLFVSRRMADLARPLIGRAGMPAHWFAVDDDVTGFAPYQAAAAAFPPTPIADERLGREMLYSSGTTGRPKGVKHFLPPGDIDTPHPVLKFMGDTYGFSDATINLTPGPLYHASGLRYSMLLGQFGATNIVMEKYDAEQMLALIASHRVTHVEPVPTMLVRLIKLAPVARARYDLSSLKGVIHGAGPCPPEVKRALIDWLGPIVCENYGASEGNGLCLIDSREWLAHPGSVGKAVIGRLHIVGEDGAELPLGETGLVYFEGGPDFAYHGDPDKTAEAYHPQGWSTLGDIGHVDAEGYLYLTDRKSHMIISGGVKIWPLETENVLTTHPKVLDVAVFGVPNEDFGEEVRAIVHPVDMAEAGPDLERELIAFCRARISHIKCPRSISFSTDLPRHENGKILKRLLRDQVLGVNTTSADPGPARQ